MAEIKSDIEKTVLLRMLHERMRKEQQTYRKWLLSQNKEEVLKLAPQYYVREQAVKEIGNSAPHGRMGNGICTPNRLRFSFVPVLRLRIYAANTSRISTCTAAMNLRKASMPPSTTAPMIYCVKNFWNAEIRAFTPVNQTIPI